MLTDEAVYYGPSYKTGNCYLFYASSPLGPWTAHPKNPIIRDDTSKSGGAGRPILYADNTLLRLTQKCDTAYGRSVRVFQVDKLTKTDYAEHELTASPLISASGRGWNKNGMHTLNAWWNGNQWIACVDGVGDYGIWTIGICTTSTSASYATITVTLNMQPINLILVLDMTPGEHWTAPATINTSGRTWHFLKWSDGSTDQTKTFTADAHYVITYT
jgi:hypothetical protein